MTQTLASQPADQDQSSNPRPARRRGRRRAAVAAVTATAVVGVAGLAIANPFSRTDDHPPSVQRIALPADPPAAAPQDPSTIGAVPAAVGAPDPVSAVQRYLDARRTLDGSRGLGLLVRDERQRAGSADALLVAWAEQARPVAATVLASRPGADGAVEVDVDVRYRPDLNLVTGLTFERRSEVWQAHREDGAGWQVGLLPASATPVLPTRSQAAPVVAAWLRSATSCDAAGRARLEVASPLVGSPDLAERPCRVAGTWSAGAVTDLPAGPRSEPFVTAYGPDTLAWAAAVQVTGPANELLVTVAPWGDSWRVFGVVDGNRG